VDIDVPEMVEKLKTRLVKKGYLSPKHKVIRDNILSKGNPFGD
jgi:hypothetical protein